jgi:hypothetical protein
MRVTSDVPLGCPLPLTITTVNSVQTLKAFTPTPTDGKVFVFEQRAFANSKSVIGVHDIAGVEVRSFFGVSIAFASRMSTSFLLTGVALKHHVSTTAGQPSQTGARWSRGLVLKHRAHGATGRSCATHLFAALA